MLALIIICSGPAAGQAPTPSLPYYLGNHPDDSDPGWAGALQGIAHDEDHWYFTQSKYLWKMPVTHDLADDLDPSDLPRGFGRVGIPGELAAEGYDHFGDLDQFGGILFVPLEGKVVEPLGSGVRKLTPKVIAFDAADLSVIGSADLVDARTGRAQTHAAWCAIDPATGDLYTSNGAISGSDPIRVYQVDHHALRRGGPLSLVSKETLRVTDADGAAVLIEHMQGGAFGDDGRLYLTNGFPHEHPFGGYSKHLGGIRIIDPADGVVLAKSSVSDMPFKFQFEPGTSKSEEPEGITWWDLCAGRAPGIRGQLHVILLDNDAPSDDEFFLKHYRVDVPVSVGRTVTVSIDAIELEGRSALVVDDTGYTLSLQLALDNGSCGQRSSYTDLEVPAEELDAGPFDPGAAATLSLGVPDDWSADLFVPVGLGVPFEGEPGPAPICDLPRAGDGWGDPLPGPIPVPVRQCPKGGGPEPLDWLTLTAQGSFGRADRYGVGSHVLEGRTAQGMTVRAAITIDVDEALSRSTWREEPVQSDPHGVRQLGGQ